MTAERTYRFATEADAEAFDRFMDDYDAKGARIGVPSIEMPAGAMRIFVQIHLGGQIVQIRRTERWNEFMLSTNEEKVDMITAAARDLVYSNNDRWAGRVPPTTSGLKALMTQLFGNPNILVIEDECASLVAELRPNITPNELMTIPTEQVIEERVTRSGRLHTTTTGHTEVKRFGAPRQLTPAEIEDHQAFLQDVRDMDDRKEGGVMTDRQYWILMHADGLDDALNHRTSKYADEPAYSYGYARGEAINNGG